MTMKNIRLKTGALFFLCVYFIISCGDINTKTEHLVSATAPDLKGVITNLPEAPGYQTFNMNCVICHSARMVQIQPNLPEKTWKAIVTKMQKSYGAPISDSAANIIVQYLMAIKGKS